MTNSERLRAASLLLLDVADHPSLAINGDEVAQIASRLLALAGHVELNERSSGNDAWIKLAVDDYRSANNIPQRIDQRDATRADAGEKSL